MKNSKLLEKLLKNLEAKPIEEWNINKLTLEDINIGIYSFRVHISKRGNLYVSEEGLNPNILKDGGQYSGRIKNIYQSVIGLHESKIEEERARSLERLENYLNQKN